MDQVLSFAALRTDLDLNVLDEITIEVAYRRDMIPSAEAYLIHHIGMSGRETVSEASAIQKIYKELNKPNTISGGYNTLGFDDEFLRFSFYRCLLPPYNHQFQNGCSRFDILPMVVFYYLYANDALKWPLIQGKPSFKLENLNRENGWDEGRSHEAMVDVKITRALMYALKEKREIWDYLLGFYDKQIDQQRTHELLKDNGVGIMINLFFGYDCHYQAPVLFLGPHTQYKNQIIFLRLDVDLASSDIASLTLRKKFGEPGFLLPYKPKYKENLSALVLKTVEKNLSFLESQNIDEIKNVACGKTYASVDNIDIDVDLYTRGFQTSKENSWSLSFHKNLENALPHCPSNHLKKRALRYLWRFHLDNVPQDLLPETNASIAAYLSQSVDHMNRPGLRAEEALLQVEEARASTLDEQLLQGLDEILHHIQTIPLK